MPYRTAARSEEADGRISWGLVWARESLWFERRSTDMITGAYTTRLTRKVSGHSATAAEAAGKLRGMPWEVVVFQAPAPAEASGTPRRGFSSVNDQPGGRRQELE